MSLDVFSNAIASSDSFFTPYKLQPKNVLKSTNRYYIGPSSGSMSLDVFSNAIASSDSFFTPYKLQPKNVLKSTNRYYIGPSSGSMSLDVFSNAIASSDSFFTPYKLQPKNVLKSTNRYYIGPSSGSMSLDVFSNAIASSDSFFTPYKLQAYQADDNLDPLQPFTSPLASADFSMSIESPLPYAPWSTHEDEYKQFGCSQSYIKNRYLSDPFFFHKMFRLLFTGFADINTPNVVMALHPPDSDMVKWHQYKLVDHH
ncbi:UNVERIFIED_CONTAM: hypothetical protein FKN15_024661 [Acipenser sinensis]